MPTLIIMVYIGYFLILIVVFILLASIIRGAPFVPSYRRVVEQMVSLADVKPWYKVADLGSGDGRIVIAFAKAGAAETHGYEINPFLVWVARRNIKKEGLSGKAFIHWGSFWRYTFTSFDVITIFGITHIMNGLEKKLNKELKTGAQVLSNAFPFPAWPPERKEEGIYIYKKGEENS